MGSAASDFYNVAVKLVDGNVERGYGEKVAIKYLEQEITYNQVLDQVNKFGNGLRELGIGLEDRVLLLLLDCPQFVYSFFGAIKIGAVPIPTNTLLRAEDYLYLLNDSRAKVAVVSAELLHLVEQIRDKTKFLKHVIVVGDSALENSDNISYDRFVADQSNQLVPAETCADDPAFWLYSSGTTGFPKGTVHLHHDMIYAAESFGKEILQIKPEDVTYSVAKLFFAYGLGNGLYFPFWAGATTVLSPLRPEPEVVLKNVQKYRPTLFFGVPTSYTAMLQVPGEWDFSSVRMCVSAGEALPEIIFQRWRERFNIEIIDGIGSTEILHIFISNRPGQVVPGSTGKIVPGYEARVVGEDGQPLPAGEVGILHVKGDSIAAYYWNKHEKTKETFLGEWINTGDRFYQDEQGYFWYVGRGDDMIKAGGIWVSPLEVENTLMKHQAVLECGVIGKADKDNLIKPKAFVVLKEGYQPSEQLANELKQFVKGAIAHYKYPRWIQFVSELPKTATGKIQRYKLRQLEVETEEQAG